MPNGELHTGASHNKDSQKLFHFDDLSPAAKKKANSQKAAKKNAPKKVAKKKVAKKKVAKKKESFPEAVERRMRGQ